ncbi:transposase family protein [Mesorhizobium sp. C264A]|uniref:transposase family protein n=1 Tax=Mesorhizobium sp. C264A TaxID=2956825 RepID=UPI00247813D2|nr:transposase family protein [Mesorhizobium sp. LSJC264A00]
MLVARPKATESCCPSCGCRTGRVHSHYMRRVADLPWQGRVVEIRLHVSVSASRGHISSNVTTPTSVVCSAVSD